jgi:hypothetical protein
MIFTQAHLGAEVKLRGQHLPAYRPDEKPLIVVEVTSDYVKCLLEDRIQTYKYGHDALELVRLDPSGVKPKSGASGIQFGAY